MLRNRYLEGKSREVGLEGNLSVTRSQCRRVTLSHASAWRIPGCRGGLEEGRPVKQMQQQKLRLAQKGYKVYP